MKGQLFKRMMNVTRDNEDIVSSRKSNTTPREEPCARFHPGTNSSMCIIFDNIIDRLFPFKSDFSFMLVPLPLFLPFTFSIPIQVFSLECT